MRVGAWVGAVLLYSSALRVNLSYYIVLYNYYAELHNKNIAPNTNVEFSSLLHNL